MVISILKYATKTVQFVLHSTTYVYIPDSLLLNSTKYHMLFLYKW